MSPAILQSEAELREHLQEQLAFLESSSKAFDQGFEGEAKRLAVAIRVLVHDTKLSRSLLGQLNLKTLLFCDTARDYDPRNLLSQCGLAVMQFKAGGDAKYVPLFGATPIVPTRYLPFSRWWRKVIFMDDQHNSLTRQQLVLCVADQDGGAHVDPALDETYQKLTRKHSMGMQYSNDGVTFTPVKGVANASIRQIAFELVTTLQEAKTQEEPHKQKKVGRNDPCPCNSGLKFKKCHGR